MNKYTEMTREQLLALSRKPEFYKASLRVLEGEGFDDHDSASNAATIVASKEENADSLFNGILGYAIEPRIREVVGATQKDMKAALTTDVYVLNNITQTFVKCTGQQLAGILREATKRGIDEILKSKVGLSRVAEVSLRPITEYSDTVKFSRYLEELKIKKDQTTIDKVNDMLTSKKFSIERLFEFSREVANARYYNIPSDIIKTFSKLPAEQRFRESIDSSTDSDFF